jgi:RNA polymerase sigma-70 factor (ECF subfamily)
MAPQTTPDPERETFGRELAKVLEAAVDTLPDGCREVFMLRQIEGLNTQETAESLGVSEDVVKTRLSRARAALRRELFERAGLAAENAFNFQRPRCDRVVAAVFERIG